MGEKGLQSIPLAFWKVKDTVVILRCRHEKSEKGGLMIRLMLTKSTEMTRMIKMTVIRIMMVMIMNMRAKPKLFHQVPAADLYQIFLWMSVFFPVLCLLFALVPSCQTCK